MWSLIKLVLIIFVIYKFVTDCRWQYTLFHPRVVISNAIVDLYRFIKYKEWNRLKDYGRMDIYIADERQPFGSGKTLNAVASVLDIYHKYNDVNVFDFDKGEFVKQYVHIFSNIKILSAPYVPLYNTYQLIQIANGEGVPDDGNEHVYVFLMDELGRLFNNRDWKTNINSDFLGALLQQRKNHIIIKGTVQDYSLFDATMRKICTSVYSCSKKWRFLRLQEYYAKDIERANFNTSILQVRSQQCLFATDEVYNSYDTNEVVGNLIKEIEAGEHLNNQEILNHAVNESSNIASITRLGKRYRNKQKRS